MMLIPTMATLAVSAADGEETVVINNLYDPAKATKDAIPSMESKGKTTPTAGEMASAPIEVSRGQYIYVGPCPPPTDDSAKKLGWVMAWYKKDGTYSAAKQFTSFGPENVVGTFDDGSVIYKILVNDSKYKFASLRTSAKYLDYVVMTVNEPFTKEDYFAYADAHEWDIESAGLRPIPPNFAPEAPEGFDGIWNLFPRVGERDPFLRQHQNNEYVTSDFIPVVPGDVITMGAVSFSETRSVLYAYDAEFNEIKQYKRTDIGMELVDNIGYNFGIYSHIIRIFFHIGKTHTCTKAECTNIIGCRRPTFLHCFFNIRNTGAFIGKNNFYIVICNCNICNAATGMNYHIYLAFIHSNSSFSYCVCINTKLTEDSFDIG
jgi:hypothetical protein